MPIGVVRGDNMHPSQLVTPPQAGERHTTPENIRKFFDPATYRGHVVVELPKTTSVEFERHTTPENIAKFFDPNTYRTEPGGSVSNSCQKRPAPSEASVATSVAKTAKTMTREELMEKFKLAATLNGVDWSELAVPKLQIPLVYIPMVLLSKNPKPIR